jgi:hypothetical protein
MRKFKALSFEDLKTDFQHMNAPNLAPSRKLLLCKRAAKGVVFCQHLSSRWSKFVLDPAFLIQSDLTFLRVFEKYGECPIQFGFQLEDPYSASAKIEYKFLQLLWKRGAERYILHLVEWRQDIEATYSVKSPRKK